MYLKKYYKIFDLKYSDGKELELKRPFTLVCKENCHVLGVRYRARELPCSRALCYNAQLLMNTGCCGDQSCDLRLHTALSTQQATLQHHGVCVKVKGKREETLIKYTSFPSIKKGLNTLSN